MTLGEFRERTAHLGDECELLGSTHYLDLDWKEHEGIRDICDLQEAEISKDGDDKFLVSLVLIFNELEEE